MKNNIKSMKSKQARKVLNEQRQDMKKLRRTKSKTIDNIDQYNGQLREKTKLQTNRIDRIKSIKERQKAIRNSASKNRFGIMSSEQRMEMAELRGIKKDVAAQPDINLTTAYKRQQLATARAEEMRQSSKNIAKLKGIRSGSTKQFRKELKAKQNAIKNAKSTENITRLTTNRTALMNQRNKYKEFKKQRKANQISQLSRTDLSNEEFQKLMQKKQKSGLANFREHQKFVEDLKKLKRIQQLNRIRAYRKKLKESQQKAMIQENPKLTTVRQDQSFSETISQPNIENAMLF